MTFLVNMDFGGSPHKMAATSFGVGLYLLKIQDYRFNIVLYYLIFALMIFIPVVRFGWGVLENESGFVSLRCHVFPSLF